MKLQVARHEVHAIEVSLADDAPQRNAKIVVVSDRAVDR